MRRTVVTTAGRTTIGGQPREMYELIAVHGAMEAMVAELARHDHQASVPAGSERSDIPDVPSTPADLLDGLPDGVMSVDPELRVRYANQAAARALGVPLEQLIGRAIGELALPVDVAARWGDELLAVLAGEPPREAGFELQASDGERRYEVVLAPGELSGEQLATVTCVIRDRVEQWRDVARLRAEAQRYRALVENVPAIMYAFRTSEPRGLTFVSPQVRALLDYAPEQFLSDPGFWWSVVHPDDRDRLQVILSASTARFSAEYRMVAADGRVVWVRDEAVSVPDAQGQRYWQGFIFDITGQKGLEDQLSHQAFHDTLTGLPNRALFSDRVEHAMARVSRQQHAVALMFLDLDNFKVVNDSLGHDSGDQLLIELGRRLAGTVRAGDTVARLGGDEFTVLLEDIGSAETAVEIAERIIASLRQPFSLAGRQIFVTPSIGIVLSSAALHSAEELLGAADATMYRAKRNGKSRYEIYDPAVTADELRRLELEGDLRRAVELDGFALVYQPIVSATTGQITGVEALVRWDHPARGAIPPDEFIALAEETGLIVPLGSWIVREACRQLRAWQEQSPAAAALRVSVNVSGRQFQEPKLFDDIVQALEETGLAPASLALEITEALMMAHEQVAIEVLERLRTLGVRLAIDDFGTGYSSLGWVRRLPVHELKIDHELVRESANGDGGDALILSGIVSLAHGLGLTVVAEGVETAEQLNALRRLGCDRAQGYLFAGPLSPSALGALVASGLPLAPRVS